MKKCKALSFLSGIILFITASMHQVDAEIVNYITNDSFEEDAAGSEPSGWILWKEGAEGNCRVDDSTGFKSAQALCIAGVSNVVYQYTIDVEPGAKYLVEAYCRQKGGGKTQMDVRWKNAEGKWTLGELKVIAAFKPFDGPWRKASARVTVPTNGVSKMTVCPIVKEQLSTDDRVWFDAISVQKNPPSIPNQLPKETTYILPLPQPETISAGTFDLSQREVLSTLRLSTFRYKNISADDAEKKMKEMRDFGYNAILTEGQRYLFVDKAEHPPLGGIQIGSLPFSENVRNTKIVVAACHKYGLKAYLHLTGNSVADYFAAEHPDWMTVSLKTGKQAKPVFTLLFACFNNEKFAEEYFRRLDFLIKESGTDGLMVDETSTMIDACGCPSCRKLFKKDTGFDLPEPGALWLDDLDSLLYKRFLAWRIQQYKQVLQKIREILTKHKPDGIILGYYAMPYYEKAWADHGMSIEMAAECNDIVGWEINKKEPTHRYWPNFLANLKLIRGASDYKSDSIFFIDYFKSYEERYYVWLLGLSQGSYQYRRDQPADMPLVQWEMNHEVFLAGLRSAADTAVFISGRNNNLIKNPSGSINRQNSFFAVCNTLTMARIPHKVLTDKDTQAPGLFNKTKTIIMMNSGLLSDSEAEIIRQFVNDGGTLISSAETSLYDENGNKRSNFALADLFGCSYIVFERKVKKSFIFLQIHAVSLLFSFEDFLLLR